MNVKEMMDEAFRGVELAQNNAKIAREAIRQRDELRAENDRLRKDCITLALRLTSEPADSHAPETLEVMERWRPAVDAVINPQ